MTADLKTPAEKLDGLLWEAIDYAAAHPAEARDVDPRTWQHLLTYSTYTPSPAEGDERADFEREWGFGASMAGPKEAAWSGWQARAARANVQPKGTVSEFTNELGNAIRITIEGPTSTSENVLTLMEAAKLRNALNEHAVPCAAVGAEAGDGRNYWADEMQKKADNDKARGCLQPVGYYVRSAFIYAGVGSKS